MYNPLDLILPSGHAVRVRCDNHIRPPNAKCRYPHGRIRFNVCLQDVARELGMSLTMLRRRLPGVPIRFQAEDPDKLTLIHLPDLGQLLRTRAEWPSGSRIMVRFHDQFSTELRAFLLKNMEDIDSGQAPADGKHWGVAGLTDINGATPGDIYCYSTWTLAEVAQYFAVPLAHVKTMTELRSLQAFVPHGSPVMSTSIHHALAHTYTTYRNQRPNSAPIQVKRQNPAATADYLQSQWELFLLPPPAAPVLFGLRRCEPFGLFVLRKDLETALKQSNITAKANKANIDVKDTESLWVPSPTGVAVRYAMWPAWGALSLPARRPEQKAIMDGLLTGLAAACADPTTYGLSPELSHLELTQKQVKQLYRLKDKNQTRTVLEQLGGEPVPASRLVPREQLKL